MILFEIFHCSKGCYLEIFYSKFGCYFFEIPRLPQREPSPRRAGTFEDSKFLWLFDVEQRINL